jgi:hypothetical protein
VVYQPLAVAYDRDDRFAPYDADDRHAARYSIQGVVTFSGPFHTNVRVRDRVYPVILDQGTIIKPTGVTLGPSMVVNVQGWWGPDGAFHAKGIVVLRY